jgi:cysteine synthase
MTVAVRPFRQRALTSTPLSRMRVHVGRQSRILWLKLEQCNPTGSVKYRTAIGLLDALDAAEPLVPGTRVIESTSGNLGVALACVLEELGCRLVAVVDPRATQEVRDTIKGHGGEIVEARARDQHGGYLLTRLAIVAEMLAQDPLLRWTDQYSSPANPAIHRDTTAAELVRQTRGAVDAVLVAVSTGGTLAGISDGMRLMGHGPAVYAVDVVGSLVTSDQPSPHLLTGIGATRKSSFLRGHHYPATYRVTDTLAFTLCKILLADTGLAVGGSGGAVIAAFVEALRAGDSLLAHRCPVALIADEGGKYQATFYDDAWLARHGVLEAVTRTEAVLRRAGIGFDLVGEAGG